jgi:hypothetical protein
MQDAEQPRPAQAASRPAQLWSANVVAAPSSGPRSAAAHSLAKIKWRTAPASIYQPSTKSIKQEHEEMLALYHEAQAAGYVVDPAGGSAVVAVVSATAPPTSLVPPPGPPAAAPPLRARPCRGVSGPPLAPPGAPDASTQRSYSTLGLAEDAAPVRDLGLKSLSALSSAAGVKLEGKKCSLQTMDASAATEQQSTRSSERRYSVEGQQALPEDSCADLDYDSETTSGTEGEDEDE